VTITGACTSASLSPPIVTQATGTTVSLTAASNGCTNPHYEFWVGLPNGSWVVKQGWGGPGFSWNTSGLAAGIYVVHVWANQQGDPTGSWEAYGSATVTLT
jgi:hypothetical protein